VSASTIDPGSLQTGTVTLIVQKGAVQTVTVGGGSNANGSNTVPEPIIATLLMLDYHPLADWWSFPVRLWY